MTRIWPTLLLAALAVASARAQLKSSPAALDLGRLRQQVSVTREITLTNVGSDAVRITRVLTDCACTAAEPAQKTIAPGGKTTLTVVSESRIYQGEITQNVRVRTSRGEIVIPVKMFVSPYGDWDVDPSPVLLPVSKKSEETAGEFIAHFVGAAGAKVTGVKTDAPWLSATFAPGADAATFRVKVRKSTAAPVGDPGAHVEVATNDPAQPTLSVAVIAPVTATVRVTPNLVWLPVVKPGATARASFRLGEWDGAQPPTVNATVGEVRALGRDGADYLYEVVVTPKEAGTSNQMLQICEGKVVQLEVPLIVRAEN